MLDDAVPGLHHALLFPTLRAHRQPLETSAKIAKCSVLLSPIALVTSHDGVARFHHDRLVISLGSYFLLSFLLFICLFALPGLLFRHFDVLATINFH